MQKSKKSHPLTRILEQCVDLCKLYHTNPGIFDIENASIDIKTELLLVDHNLFKDRVGLDKFTVSDRIRVIRNTNQAVNKLITFSDAEVAAMSHDQYFTILRDNFKKYANKEIVAAMPLTRQRAMFMRYTEWYVRAFGCIPKLTIDQLGNMSRTHAAIIVKYIDLTKVTTDSRFWSNLVKHDKEHINLFIKNINSCATKTDIRSVIHKFPQIVKMLVLEDLVGSKLSIKEWVLLMGSVVTRHPDVFEGWAISEELQESLRLELSSEVLSGKSKISRQFKKHMDVVRQQDSRLESNDAETEVHEDTTTI